MSFAKQLYQISSADSHPFLKTVGGLEGSNTMTLFFSVIAIVISILTIFINQWVSPFPSLGIEFQYYRRRVQIGTAVTAILITLGLYLNSPTTGQLIVLAVVLLLTPLSGFNHASRVLVAVDRPEQVAASASGWNDDALVIGCAIDGQTACAWLLDTLIPHHLVNDKLDNVSVLAAW